MYTKQTISLTEYNVLYRLSLKVKKKTNSHNTREEEEEEKKMSVITH